jgi:hypothetical protein
MRAHFPEAIRAWGGAAAFLRIRRGWGPIRGHRKERSRLRHGPLGHGHEQKIGAKTDRERGYISALALFYRDPAANDHLKRSAAYAEAMGRLYQKYPDDLEAGAFYALSLLAAG